jgi:hypothetical protein
MTITNWLTLAIGVLAFLLLAAGGGPLVSQAGAAEAPSAPAPTRCVAPGEVLATADAVARDLGITATFELSADPANDRQALFLQFEGDEDTMVYLFRAGCLVGVNALAPKPAAPAAPRPTPKPITPA